VKTSRPSTFLECTYGDPAAQVRQEPRQQYAALDDRGEFFHAGSFVNDAERRASAKANQEKVRAGLLAVGVMGSAMARRLLDRGIAVIAWDRDTDHVRALRGHGGEPAKTPATW
jgi:hypothetical protein